MGNTALSLDLSERLLAPWSAVLARGA